MIKSTRRGLFRTASLTLLLALAACVPSTVTVLPDATDDAQLVEAASGVVLLQVADTTPYAGGLPINQVTLAPKDVKEEESGKFLRMIAVEAPGDTTSFYYAVLPANEYALRSLRSSHSVGDRYFSQFYPAGLELGTFRVEPGRVTDLGVLAVYVKRSGEDYGFASVRSPTPARTADVFREALPELAARTDNLEDPLAWEPDAYENERRSEYSNAVNRQIMFGDAWVDETRGVIRLPSQLGVFVQRNAPGAWSLEAIPRDVDLRAVTELAGEEFVVTEFDEVFRRVAPGAEWELVPVPDADGKVMLIGHHAASGYYLVRQHAEAIAVWTAPALDGPWTEAGHVELSLGFFESLDNAFYALNSEISGAQYVPLGDYLYLAARKYLYRFDLESLEFEELDVPSATSAQIRNGFITIHSRDTNLSSRVSFDQGNSWHRYAGKLHERHTTEEPERMRYRRRELFAPQFVGHPIFLDTLRAYAVREDEDSDSTLTLMATEDGAETWRPVGAETLPEGCGRLLLATDSELLLGCGLSGEFYRSTDRGDTWQLDRAPSEL